MEMLFQEMLDTKECMSGCNGYKKSVSAGRITKKCQDCPHYVKVFKRAVAKLQNEIELKK